MIIPFLITEVSSDRRDKTVYSVFRTIGITDLPVTHCDMFARWCKNWNRWSLARYFSNISGRYMRGPSSGHCSGRWTSLVQFYLTVPSGWAKASAALCWSLQGEPVALICAFYPLYFFFIYLNFIFLPPLYLLDSHKFLPVWRRSTFRFDPTLGDQ